MKAPLTTTATLTGAAEIIGMMLQNNGQENVMKEEKKTTLNGSFQMQIPLSNEENDKNVLSYSTVTLELPDNRKPPKRRVLPVRIWAQ